MANKVRVESPTGPGTERGLRLTSSSIEVDYPTKVRATDINRLEAQVSRFAAHAGLLYLAKRISKYLLDQTRTRELN